MRCLIIFCAVFLLSNGSAILFAQNTKQDAISNNEETIYKAYLQQVNELLTARGMTDYEIKNVIAQYKTNNIKSDNDLAKVIGKLYPSDRNIGILFYFYKNDSLRISFFEPGKLIEKRTIHITESQLLELGENINRSLNLYQQTASRSPQLRSVSIKNKTTNASPKKFESAISEASKILLPKGLTTAYKHLFIIPAFNISSIPFHLLKIDNDSNYLVQHCSYSIAPSIIDLIVLRYKMLKKNLPPIDFAFINQIFSIGPTATYNEEKKNKVLHIFDSAYFTFNRPMFIANPTYPTNTDYFFPDLPGAKKEIDSVKKYTTNYKVFEGSKATKDSVLAYISKADLAYFATHGVANIDSPMQKSYLVLSGSNALLTAKDIMDTRLTKKSFPEIVVLSACQTGLGKFMNAGTVGLARAFLIAGSNHVVMSLWNVDDEATAYLMNRFVYHLKNGNRHMPSGALRLAVLDTKKVFSNPSKWAGFTVFGVDF